MAEAPGTPPPPGPSAVDDLVNRTRKFLGEIAHDYLKRPLDDLFRWALGRAVSYAVAAGLLITAVVFLLIAGVEGLKSARVHPAVAYLALGLVGVLSGLLVLRASRLGPRK